MNYQHGLEAVFTVIAVMLFVTMVGGFCAGIGWLGQYYPKIIVSSLIVLFLISIFLMGSGA